MRGQSGEGRYLCLAPELELDSTEHSTSQSAHRFSGTLWEESWQTAELGYLIAQSLAGEEPFSVTRCRWVHGLAPATGVPDRHALSARVQRLPEMLE